MATPEELKNIAKQAADEFSFLNEQIVSLNSKIQESVTASNEYDAATKRVVKTYSNDLSKAINSIKKDAQKIADLQEKQGNDIKLSAKEQKDLAAAQSKIAKNRKIAEDAINVLKRNGADISAELNENLNQGIDNIEAQGSSASELSTELIAQRGITGLIADNFKEYVNKLDKSGVLTKLFNGELNTTQKLSLAAEAALIGIANGILRASDRIAGFQKSLGISSESARSLSLDLSIASAESGKLFVTSEKLTESFNTLVDSTGLLADFGGDTLVTMTALTKQLGLGTNEASQLALLARTQGEDTEGVLNNTVDTVNAINKQNKSAISAKAVLNDIATASKSIVVSLGMSPEILAEAATEARALGLNLETVDKIAGSLLDFESSIAAELEAELLLGQDINLEKARQAALTNDLATLSQEIGKNEGVINAFATGNRIQQEAAAKALGMSREELAGMVMQQEFMNLSQDAFIAKFGEQSYQQMQAQSASEKFAAILEKIQGIFTDIGIIFAPILDGFATLVGLLAQSKVFAMGLAGVLTALAAKSLITAVAQIFGSAFSLGPLGLGIAAAGTALLFNQAAKAKQQVNDGIAPANKGPFTITDSFGATAITAKGDGVAVSPNINRGSSDSGEQKRTNMLLEKLLAKDTNISMDGRRLNDSMQTSAVAYNIGN
jgi:hypothetical protein